ncbi:MAG: hypothetical protein AAF741_12530 [Bacteroidota bacterium]
MKSFLVIALVIIWLLLSSIFLLVGFVPGFEYSIPLVQHLLFATMILGSLVILWRRKKEHGTWRAILYTFVFAAVMVFYTAGNLMDFCGPNKTQTIIYQHKEQANRTIDFQMWSCGAVGGNGRRIVEVRRLPLGIRYYSQADTSDVDLSEWDLVNIELNEMGLKGG